MQERIEHHVLSGLNQVEKTLPVSSWVKDGLLSASTLIGASRARTTCSEFIELGQIRALVAHDPWRFQRSERTRSVTVVVCVLPQQAGGKDEPRRAVVLVRKFVPRTEFECEAVQDSFSTFWGVSRFSRNFEFLNRSVQKRPKEEMFLKRPPGVLAWKNMPVEINMKW